MNQNQIKWLATILMVVDHIGVLTESEPMRIIGRLSFPLFAWVFTQNWQLPGEKKKLINRLLLFGVISQIPYILLFNNLQLNIMFSFAAAATTFSCIRKFNRKIAILGIGLASSQILGISYGWYAVACPLMMISLKGKGDRLWWFGWSITNIIYAISSNSLIQLFEIFAPIILAYNNPDKNQKPTAIEKKIFYYFYPVHLAALAALQTII
ncbi:TraX family protein [Microcoleus sp. herbarium14]|uniref:TraX family protein n=1 Tax=Microcoleus sp. herbarium14 TaxID=3055439 RepID=UPI002FCFFA23